MSATIESQVYTAKFDAAAVVQKQRDFSLLEKQKMLNSEFSNLKN
jgi:hypothetical protein